MRYAIIDVGSNTIRMVVCTIENGHAEISGNERESSIILRCIKNGRLSFEGITFLIDTMNKMKSCCGEVDGIFAFATASLRNVDNAEDVCRIVEESTGVNIQLISGEQEAEYDFYSLKFINKTKEQGIGLDLGGGSCQLFSFENDILKDKVSLLIGSSRIYSRFVENVIPTVEEAQSIYSYISEQIGAYKQFCGFENIYAIGGSARCAVALYNEVFSNESMPLKGKILVSQLEKLYKTLIADSETARNVLNLHFPDRIESLIPGIITLCAICDTVGAKKLMIAVSGVREGFICKELLQ